MKQDDDETDLRRAFAALRQEDAERAPSFEALLAGGRAPGRGRGRGLLLSGLLAASAMAAVLVVVTMRGPAPLAKPSMEQWAAPTDFLLKTPGREILETVPRFGAPPSLDFEEGVPGGAPSPSQRSVLP